jgi:Heterokaryon incompatibility protein (HET)
VLDICSNKSLGTRPSSELSRARNLATMRLLKCAKAGDFYLTKDFVGNDIVPPYAVLSHTWGEDEDEVTFNDLQTRTGRSKAGYKKIQFCGEQAAKDGLNHFWIDTCCIDKSNNTELSEAINSMFRWYQDAAKCYVYLSDVSTNKRKAGDWSSELSWESAFRASRWFTRGWTVQELIAPASVEFFSMTGYLIGSKATLNGLISDITQIDVRALRGDPLSGFSIDERFSWAECRHTKRPEDKAYCLLGILSVRMRLDYGEGEEAAFTRLRKKIQKLQM